MLHNDPTKASLRAHIFSVEQTSSGAFYYRRLPPQTLPYPVISVADSDLKLGLENELATPQTILTAFLASTNTTLSGKSVMIFGYGPVGQGLARLCQAFGALVTVVELDSTRRLIAKARGFQFADIATFRFRLPVQDVIISATSNRQGSTIGLEEVCLMKDCAIVFNAGSGTGEIAQQLLEPGAFERHRVKVRILESDRNIVCVTQKLDMEKHVLILGSGYPANLHLAAGSPAQPLPGG